MDDESVQPEKLEEEQEGQTQQKQMEEDIIIEQEVIEQKVPPQLPQKETTITTTGNSRDSKRLSKQTDTEGGGGGEHRNSNHSHMPHIPHIPHMPHLPHIPQLLHQVSAERVDMVLSIWADQKPVDSLGDAWKRSAVLWIAPFIFCFAWLSLPLSHSFRTGGAQVDAHCENINFFVTYHAFFYVTVMAYTTSQVYWYYFPTMVSNKILIILTALCIGVDLMVLYLFYFVGGSLTRIPIMLSSIISLTPVIAGYVFAIFQKLKTLVKPPELKAMKSLKSLVSLSPSASAKNFIVDDVIIKKNAAGGAAGGGGAGSASGGDSNRPVSPNNNNNNNNKNTSNYVCSPSSTSIHSSSSVTDDEENALQKKNNNNYVDSNIIQPQEQKEHEGGEKEENGGGSIDDEEYKRRNCTIYNVRVGRNPYVQLFYVTATLAGVIACYFYCQLFTFIFFRYAGTNVRKVLLGGFYPLTLVPFRWVIRYFVTLADSGLDPNITKVPLVYMSEWIMQLFYLMFYRNLFTSIAAISTFAILQSIQLADELIQFPFRMTRLYERMRFVFLSTLSLDPEPIKNDIDFRKEQIIVASRYYFVTMAQRISLSFFICALLLIRNIYNANFYNISALSGAQYNKLILFLVVMAFVEWSCSTVVWLVIRQVYSIDVVHFGGDLMRNPFILKLSVLICIHVIQDVYVAINKYNFC